MHVTNFKTLEKYDVNLRQYKNENKMECYDYLAHSVAVINGKFQRKCIFYDFLVNTSLFLF